MGSTSLTFEMLESVDKHEYRFQFYFFLEEFDDFICSECETGDYVKFVIIVKHAMDQSRNENIIKLELRAEYLADNISEMDTSFIFSMNNCSGDVYFVQELNGVFSDDKKSIFSSDLIKPKPFKVNRDCLGNNVEFLQSIYFRGYIKINNFKYRTQVIKNMSNENVLQLQHDFRSLLGDKEFSDVTLTQGKDIIHAHKCVLSVRSPVFRRMFVSDMQEARQNNVNLIDTEKSVLEAFLLFLYTGTIECMDFDSLTALYSLGDKYEVEMLKKTCCAILVSKTSMETVFYLLKLALLHSDSCLEKTAVDFIYNNYEKVYSSDMWKDLLTSDTHLSAFILKQVASRIAQKRELADNLKLQII